MLSFHHMVGTVDFKMVSEQRILTEHQHRDACDMARLQQGKLQMMSPLAPMN